MNYSRISGIGYYLPKKILTNHDLEKMVDTSDEWIQQRTGIQARHIAGENELPSDMALKASLKAFEHSGLKAQNLDLILVATIYPDQIMPNTACILQKKLGISNIPAMDISAACSGFVYALSIANQYIQTGTYKNILVVGTETLHHLVNYEDRGTCILFGDGAGALVLSQTKDKKQGCVYHQKLKAYGELGSLLYIPEPRNHHPIEKKQTSIHMEGQAVFKKAVGIMCEAYKNTLKDTGRTPEQIDWFVPHQANERILKKFCAITGFPLKKVIVDIKDIGNTSSASIPISMARAIEKKQIKRGQDILIVAMGGGMTSGSLLLRY